MKGIVSQGGGMAAINEPTNVELQRGRSQEAGSSDSSEMAMDSYLATLGLYRKPVAKDGSCLFRVVAEQVYNSQARHLDVRKECVKFMKENAEMFQGFVEGSFEHHIYHLQKPKEWAGQVEIYALSLLYQRDFIVYQSVDGKPTYVTNNGYKDKIYLCFSNGNHYDCVYPSEFKENAALVQALLFEHLYTAVFPEIEERELQQAHDVEDSNLTDGFPNGWKEVNRKGLKGKNGEEISVPLSSTDHSIQWEISRSLDPTAYRNIELEVWEQSRNDQQSNDRLLALQAQYRLGDVCFASLKNAAGLEGLYKVRIEDIGDDQAIYTVTAVDLNHKYAVVLEDLQPLANPDEVISYRELPGYYRKGDAPEKDPEFQVNKRRSKAPRKGGHTEESALGSDGRGSSSQRSYAKGKEFRKNSATAAGACQGSKLKGSAGDKRDEDNRLRSSGKRGSHHTTGGGGGTKSDGSGREEEVKSTAKRDGANRGKSQGEGSAKDRREKRPVPEGKSYKRDRGQFDRRGKGVHEATRREDAVLAIPAEVEQDIPKSSLGGKDGSSGGKDGSLGTADAPAKVETPTEDAEGVVESTSEKEKPEKIKQNFESSADFYSRMRKNQVGKVNRGAGNGTMQNSIPVDMSLTSTDSNGSLADVTDDRDVVVSHGKYSRGNLSEATDPASSSTDMKKVSTVMTEGKRPPSDKLAITRGSSSLSTKVNDMGRLPKDGIKETASASKNTVSSTDYPGCEMDATLVEESVNLDSIGRSDTVEGTSAFGLCISAGISVDSTASVQEHTDLRAFGENANTESQLTFMHDGFSSEAAKHSSSDQKVPASSVCTEEKNAVPIATGLSPEMNSYEIRGLDATDQQNSELFIPTSEEKPTNIVLATATDAGLVAQERTGDANKPAYSNEEVDGKDPAYELYEPISAEQLPVAGRKGGQEQKIRILRKDEQLPDVCSKNCDAVENPSHSNSHSTGIRSPSPVDDLMPDKTASSIMASNEANREKKRKKVTFVVDKHVELGSPADLSPSSSQLPVALSPVEVMSESTRPCQPVASMAGMNGPIPFQMPTVQNALCQDSFVHMNYTQTTRMSIDPHGRDLPWDDPLVLQYFYNLGVMWFSTMHPVQTSRFPTMPMPPQVPSSMVSTSPHHFATTNEPTSLASESQLNQNAQPFHPAMNHRPPPATYRNNAPQQPFQQQAYSAQPHSYQGGHAGMQGGPSFRHQKYNSDMSHGNVPEVPPRFQKQKPAHRNMQDHGQQRQPSQRNQMSYR